jgi:hypothetical protein
VYGLSYRFMQEAQRLGLQQRVAALASQVGLLMHKWSLLSSCLEAGLNGLGQGMAVAGMLMNDKRLEVMSCYGCPN